MQYVETFERKNLPGKAHIVYTSLGYRVMCENKEGISDWPIQYWHGGIAYHNPHILPAYVKNLCAKAYRRLNIAYPLVQTFGVPIL